MTAAPADHPTYCNTLFAPRVRQTFGKSGGEVLKATPEEYVRRMQEEHARWVKIRKETGIRLE